MLNMSKYKSLRRSILRTNIQSKPGADDQIRNDKATKIK